MSAELTHRGSPCFVVDTAETATFWHTPRGCAGPAVSLLDRIVDLHMWGALSQVFAVMAQAVLGNLDGVEIALRAPLSGQRHTWMQTKEEEKEKKDMISKCRKCIEI